MFFFAGNSRVQVQFKHVFMLRIVKTLISKYGILSYYLMPGHVPVGSNRKSITGELHEHHTESSQDL